MRLPYSKDGTFAIEIYCRCTGSRNCTPSIHFYGKVPSLEIFLRLSNQLHNLGFDRWCLIPRPHLSHEGSGLLVYLHTFLGRLKFETAFMEFMTISTAVSQQFRACNCTPDIRGTVSHENRACLQMTWHLSVVSTEWNERFSVYSFKVRKLLADFHPEDD